MDITEPVCIDLIDYFFYFSRTCSCFYQRVFEYCEILEDFSLWQYHKRHERDLLDQKKEKEETLLLEMVRAHSCRRIKVSCYGVCFDDKCTVLF